MSTPLFTKPYILCFELEMGCIEGPSQPLKVEMGIKMKYTSQ